MTGIDARARPKVDEAGSRPDAGAAPVVSVGPGPARRSLDVLLAGGALLVLSPLLALLAAAVRLSSAGPAIFRQARVGQGGRTFTLYKFRTMRRGGGGPDLTVPGDARVTPVGRFLRATSLDELPQLLNVLRGDMTLVGPRPETPALAARYPEDCRPVFRYRPGLTGPAQIRHRDRRTLSGELVDPEAYYLTRLVPARTSLDLEYLARPTLRRTLGWILATVAHLVGLPSRPKPPEVAHALGSGAPDGEQS
jgi:lipopolysaccharide/colanic/teichoic acid biosynthesis glycosyltransferase